MKIAQEKHLDDLLFGQELERALYSGAIRTDAKGKVVKHSDFYGALRAAEQFFQVEGADEGTVSKKNYILQRFLELFFVPNFKLGFREGVNDRVRRVVYSQEAMPSSVVLQKLVSEAEHWRKVVKNPRKYGCFDDPAVILEKQVSKTLKYAELVRKSHLKLRPRETGKVDLSNLSGVHGAILNHFQNDSFERLVDVYLEDLEELELSGDFVGDSLFYNKGRRESSTPGFTREWKKTLKLTERVEGKRVISFPSMKPLSYVFGGLVTAGLVLGGVGLAVPPVRYAAGIELSLRDKVERLYQEGDFTGAGKVLGLEIGKDNLSSEEINYWESKLNVGKRVADWKEKKTVEGKYELARSMFNVEEDIASAFGDDMFVDIGWIKQGQKLYLDHDLVDRTQVAISYVHSLLKQEDNLLEPAEREVKEILLDGSGIYLGRGTDEYFFALKNSKGKIEELVVKLGEGDKVQGFYLARK